MSTLRQQTIFIPVEDHYQRITRWYLEMKVGNVMINDSSTKALAINGKSMMDSRHVTLEDVVATRREAWRLSRGTFISVFLNGPSVLPASQ
jgi:hypothetical protein